MADVGAHVAGVANEVIGQEGQIPVGNNDIKRRKTIPVHDFLNRLYLFRYQQLVRDGVIAGLMGKILGKITLTAIQMRGNIGGRDCLFPAEVKEGIVPRKTVNARKVRAAQAKLWIHFPKCLIGDQIE